MASIETRRSKDGRTASYRVKWRTGGTGVQDGTTFSALSDAKRFKALVEVHGHLWPPVEVLVAHGFRSLVPGALVPVATSPVVTEERSAVTFEAYAVEFVDR